MNNILEGLIWFWVPASLVVCNDVFAYICGITMGRTPLIKLSPKKTVEGFVGAIVCTVVFAIVWGTFFSKFNYMICPVHDLGVNAWSNMKCTPNPVFVWREWIIWPPVARFLSTIVRPPLFLHREEVPLTMCVTSSWAKSTRSPTHRINSISCLWHALLRWSLRLVVSLLLVSSVLSTSKTSVTAFQDMAA